MRSWPEISVKITESPSEGIKQASELHMIAATPQPNQEPPQKKHPVEDLLVDGICSGAKLTADGIFAGAKLTFKVTKGAAKIAGPIAGRIATKVGVRAGKAAISSPAAKWLVKPPAKPAGFFETTGKVIYLIMRIVGIC
jgi:hypothetical protein